MHTSAQEPCIWLSGRFSLPFGLEFNQVWLGQTERAALLSKPLHGLFLRTCYSSSLRTPFWVSLSSRLTQIHLIHPLSLHLNVIPAGESLLIHRNMQSPASTTFLSLRLVHLNPPVIKFFWAQYDLCSFLDFFKYYFYFYTCLAISLLSIV